MKRSNLSKYGNKIACERKLFIASPVDFKRIEKYFQKIEKNFFKKFYQFYVKSTGHAVCLKRLFEQPFSRNRELQLLLG